MAKKVQKHRFAVCIESADDLSVWKLYQVLPDLSAEKENYLPLVDESGEDYLYPASRFVIVEFSENVEKRLMSAATAVA